LAIVVGLLLSPQKFVRGSDGLQELRNFKVEGLLQCSWSRHTFMKRTETWSCCKPGFLCRRNFHDKCWNSFGYKLVISHVWILWIPLFVRSKYWSVY